MSSSLTNLENDTVELARIVHRKDIYKYFPDE